MKVNEMDKYELTKVMKEVKEYIDRPDVSFFDVPEEYFETILNPPTDKEGYVHKYYLTDDVKLFVESLMRVISMNQDDISRCK